MLLALSALLALVALLCARWGRPRVAAEIRGELVVPPVSDGGAVAWIERQNGADTLVVLKPRRELLASSSLSGLAVSGNAAYTALVGAVGDSPQLVTVGLRSGARKELASLSGPATEIVAGGDWVCWLSTRPAALPAAPFVVAGGPVTAIWVLSRRGDHPRVVAQLSASGGVDLLGVVADKLYWAERQGQSMRLRGQGLSAGGSETLVSEPGYRSAVLLGDRVAWTASSQEAALPDQYCAVKVRPLSDDGNTTVIADWLQPDAALLRSGAALYAQERDALWRLGARRGDQRVLYRTSYGARDQTVSGGVEYLVERHGKTARLIKRGLTWAGKLRVLVDL
jgi:hypothetical protein